MYENIIRMILDSPKRESENIKLNRKIAKIHKYWARKPFDLVDLYIKKYSDEGDLVVDPFLGSGTTGLAAIINNRNFFGVDLNPIAIRVTDSTLNSNIKIEDLKNQYSLLEKTIKTEVLNLYKTTEKCSICGNDLYVYHKVIDGEKIGSGKLVCNVCGNKVYKHNLNEINVAYDKYTIKECLPKKDFPERFYKDRFSYKGVNKVDDLYTNRNLAALSIIKNQINQINKVDVKSFFEVVFSNTVLHVSKLKSENVRPMSVNSYWIPNDFIEENVWMRFENRFNFSLSSKEAIYNSLFEINKLGSYKLLKGSSLLKENLPKADYIFADPPYGDTIQYYELSYVWNSWMMDTVDPKDEIIINPVQNKRKNEYLDLIDLSIKNIFSSLKKGKYFTLCFNNKDSSIWTSVIESCKKSGFILDDIKVFDTHGNSFNKNWAKFSPKNDLYITFRKTDLSLTKNNKSQDTFEDIIIEVIDYFKSNKLKVDFIQLYDIVMGIVIWKYFYFNDSIISDFSTKQFVQIAKKLAEKEM